MTMTHGILIVLAGLIVVMACYFIGAVYGYNEAVSDSMDTNKWETWAARTRARERAAISRLKGHYP